MRMDPSDTSQPPRGKEELGGDATINRRIRKRLSLMARMAPKRSIQVEYLAM